MNKLGQSLTETDTPERLPAAVLKLKPRQRAVLALLVKGRTFSQVASETGISRTSIWQRVNHNDDFRGALAMKFDDQTLALKDFGARCENEEGTKSRVIVVLFYLFYHEAIRGRDGKKM